MSDSSYSSLNPWSAPSLKSAIALAHSQAFSSHSSIDVRFSLPSDATRFHSSALSPTEAAVSHLKRAAIKQIRHRRRQSQEFYEWTPPTSHSGEDDAASKLSQTVPVENYSYIPHIAPFPSPMAQRNKLRANSPHRPQTAAVNGRSRRAMDKGEKVSRPVISTGYASFSSFEWVAPLPEQPLPPISRENQESKEAQQTHQSHAAPSPFKTPYRSYDADVRVRPVTAPVDHSLSHSSTATPGQHRHTKSSHSGRPQSPRSPRSPRSPSGARPISSLSRSRSPGPSPAPLTALRPEYAAVVFSPRVLKSNYSNPTDAFHSRVQETMLARDEWRASHAAEQAKLIENRAKTSESPSRRPMSPTRVEPFRGMELHEIEASEKRYHRAMTPPLPEEKMESPRAKSAKANRRNTETIESAQQNITANKEEIKESEDDNATATPAKRAESRKRDNSAGRGSAAVSKVEIYRTPVKSQPKTAKAKDSDVATPAVEKRPSVAHSAVVQGSRSRPMTSPARARAKTPAAKSRPEAETKADSDTKAGAASHRVQSSRSPKARSPAGRPATTPGSARRQKNEPEQNKAKSSRTSATPVKSSKSPRSPHSSSAAAPPSPSAGGSTSPSNANRGFRRTSTATGFLTEAQRDAIRAQLQGAPAVLSSSVVLSPVEVDRIVRAAWEGTPHLHLLETQLCISKFRDENQSFPSTTSLIQALDKLKAQFHTEKLQLFVYLTSDEGKQLLETGDDEDDQDQDTIKDTPNESESAAAAAAALASSSNVDSDKFTPGFEWNVEDAERLFILGQAGSDTVTILHQFARVCITFSSFSELCQAVQQRFSQLRHRMQSEISQLFAYLQSPTLQLIRLPGQSNANSASGAASFAFPLSRYEAYQLRSLGHTLQEILRELEYLEWEKRRYSSFQDLHQAVSAGCLKSRQARQELFSFLKAPSTVLLRGDSSSFSTDGSQRFSELDLLTLEDCERIYEQSLAGHFTRPICDQLQAQGVKCASIRELIETIQKVYMQDYKSNAHSRAVSFANKALPDELVEEARAMQLQAIQEGNQDPEQ